MPEIFDLYLSSNPPCISLSVSSFKRALKESGKIRFRYPKVRHFYKMKPLNKVRSRYLLKILLRAIKEQARLVFGDESSFANDVGRQKTWQEADCHEIVLNNKSLASFSLTIAVTETEVLHHSMVNVRNTGALFQQFLLETLKKLRKADSRTGETGRKTVIVVDNCPTHKSKKILALAREHGAQVAFLPGYAPELNAAELFFASIKQKARKRLWQRQRVAG